MITYRKRLLTGLYDGNVATKIAQFILLGVGGAKLVDVLNFNPEIYHLNEAHGVSSVFYLYKKFGNTEEVIKALGFYNTYSGRSR